MASGVRLVAREAGARRTQAGASQLRTQRQQNPTPPGSLIGSCAIDRGQRGWGVGGSAPIVGTLVGSEATRPYRPGSARSRATTARQSRPTPTPTPTPVEHDLARIVDRGRPTPPPQRRGQPGRGHGLGQQHPRPDPPVLLRGHGPGAGGGDAGRARERTLLSARGQPHLLLRRLRARPGGAASSSDDRYRTAGGR